MRQYISLFISLGLFFIIGGCESKSDLSINNDVGQGGSMARFTIVGNYLYTVDHSDLHIFDISTPDNPIEKNKVNAGWEVETIYALQNKLFIGAARGMTIFDISNPINPAYVFDFEHWESCDPVVSDGEYAYVTLSSDESRCFRGLNQLDVFYVADLIDDISPNDSLDIVNYYSYDRWVASYPMSQPKGLGIDGDLLFICDGWDGLKVFDKSAPTLITNNLIAHFPNIKTYDVIPLTDKKILLMIAEDGFYQYDYNDINNISLLSHIAVNTP